MNNAIAIRKKVAELCGYEALYLYPFAGVDIWKGEKDGDPDQTIPKYELSLDAIYEALANHKIKFALQIAFQGDEIGCLATNLDTGRESFSDSPAHALCYLFIHAMEDNP